MAKFYIPDFGIQKNIIKALSNYKQLNALNKGVGIEYENLMLVLGNNSNIFRTYFKEEQSGRFRDSNFSDYIKQVANQGADITISSKYGLEKTMESFKNVPNVTGFSCNNGAYVMAFDKNGHEHILRDEKISPTAIKAIEQVLAKYSIGNNGINFFTSVSGLDKSYSSLLGVSRVVSGPFANFRANRINKKGNSGFAVPKSLYKKIISANAEITNTDTQFNPNLYESSKSAAYGFTVSALLGDKLDYKGKSVNFNIYENQRFLPKLLKKDKQSIQATKLQKQKAINMQVVAALVNAEPSLRSLYENEIALTFTEDGIKIVPKGCDKVSADALIAKFRGKELSNVQRIVSEVDELSKSIPLSNIIANADKLNADNFNELGLIKNFSSFPVEFCDIPNLSTVNTHSINISSSLGKDNNIIDGCKENLVKIKNNHTLRKFKEDAEDRLLINPKTSAEQKLKDGIEEFKNSNPEATDEQIEEETKRIKEKLEKEEQDIRAQIDKLSINDIKKEMPEKIIDSNGYSLTNYEQILKKMNVLNKASDVRKKSAEEVQHNDFSDYENFINGDNQQQNNGGPVMGG